MTTLKSTATTIAAQAGNRKTPDEDTALLKINARGHNMSQVRLLTFGLDSKSLV